MRLTDIYLLLVRLLLGYIFASAGLSKLTQGQFGGLIGPPTAAFTPGLESIWPLLALSQVMVGALVLSGRWSLAGLLGLVPINTGILAYTIANHWSGTPFINGLLLLLNLICLAAEWQALRFLVQPEDLPVALPRAVQFWPGWHLPLVVFGMLGPIGLVSTAAITVVYSWLFHETGGSALLTLVFHAVQDSVTFGALGYTGPDLVRAEYLYCAVVVTLAVFAGTRLSSSRPATTTGTATSMTVPTPGADEAEQRSSKTS